jgi:hypothetical protein
MGAQYVARFQGGEKGKHSSVTHKIRDGWSYDNISNARTGCGMSGPFAVEHLQSGRDLPVTCRRTGCDGE